jgi:hypothetical protein
MTPHLDDPESKGHDVRAPDFVVFAGRYRDPVAPGLTFADEDGVEVVLDADEAVSLLGITRGLDAATVSACPGCRSRVLAAVALVDLLDASAPHARSGELVELADQAPTLHVYVIDDAAKCAHRRWRDPLAAEWQDVIEISGPPARP